MAANPPQPLTTERIQQMLEENFLLIKAIVDSQNLSRLEAMNQLGDKLQNNLMQLAALADAQPQSGAGPTVPNPAPVAAPAAAPASRNAPSTLDVARLQLQMQQQAQLQAQQQLQQAQQAPNAHMGLAAGGAGSQAPGMQAGSALGLGNPQGLLGLNQAHAGQQAFPSQLGAAQAGQLGSAAGLLGTSGAAGSMGQPALPAALQQQQQMFQLQQAAFLQQQQQAGFK